LYNEGIMEKVLKYIDIITALFVAVLLISNITSTKIVSLGWWLSFDGGTFLFPLSYIFGDVLTEVYGYKRARRVIWLGFLANLLMALIVIIVGKLPAASDWHNQQAYDAVLGLAPRIVLASLIAYLAGEFLNSYILAKLKILTHGRHLWVRTIGSTLAGQVADTLLFVVIAFGGILPWSLVATVIISNYIFKCGVEIVLTPVTYKAVNWLKRQEGEDYYDRGTEFNPFNISC